MHQKQVNLLEKKRPESPIRVNKLHSQKETNLQCSNDHLDIHQHATPFLELLCLPHCDRRIQMSIVLKDKSTLQCRMHTFQDKTHNHQVNCLQCGSKMNQLDMDIEYRTLYYSNSSNLLDIRKNHTMTQVRMSHCSSNLEKVRRINHYELFLRKVI